MVFAKIVEKSPPLTYHHKKPSTGMKILRVLLQVFSELLYSSSEESDLYFR